MPILERSNGGSVIEYIPFGESAAVRHIIERMRRLGAFDEDPSLTPHVDEAARRGHVPAPVNGREQGGFVNRTGRESGGTHIGSR